MEIDINDTSEVLQVMGHIVPLPAPFQQRIAAELHTETFAARHLLLSPGDIARRVYYIKKGFLRAYFLDESSKKYTI